MVADYSTATWSSQFAMVADYSKSTAEIQSVLSGSNYMFLTLNGLITTGQLVQLHPAALRLR
jgi:hypothetical protein